MILLDLGVCRLLSSVLKNILARNSSVNLYNYEELHNFF